MRPAEQALLGLLAVFVGGAALETVEAIALSSASQSTLASRLDMVASLVDKSLLRREAPPARGQGEARFRILETVRAFALERLAASGGTAVAQRLHATALLDVVKHADAGLVGSTQALWLERIDREQDDIRVALRWAIDRDEPRLGLEMAAALRQYWRIRGHLQEGRAWLEELLAQPGATAAPLERSRALHAAGALALCQGEYADAHAALEESAALAREADDLRTLALALGELGQAAYQVGDQATAQPLLAEAVELSHARGDAGAEARALQHLGQASYELGDAARAVEMVRRSLALQQRLGDTWATASALVALAQVVEAGDEGDDPRSLLEQSLRLTQELGDRCTLVEAVESVAALAMEQGQAAQAVQLLGGASAVAESLGQRRFGIRLNRIKRTLEAGRQLLGQEGYASAWANGRAMLPDQVAEYALERHGRPIAPPAAPTPIRAQKQEEAWLTRREREVVDLLARGMTNRQIADALVIAERTAETHVCNILGKLRLSSRAQVAAWAVGGPLVAVETP
jgi:non-specific serine/threonine protein kinase